MQTLWGTLYADDADTSGSVFTEPQEDDNGKRDGVRGVRTHHVTGQNGDQLSAAKGGHRAGLRCLWFGQIPNQTHKFVYLAGGGHHRPP